LTLSDGSLYKILGENYGVNIIRMDQTLKPVTLTEEQAKLLDDIPGAPSIYSEIIAFSGAGEPVEYSWSVANGSHSAFYFSFNRENT
jgi:DNA-binding GntR family transcriptional regulator